jgi:hypothetical protein
MKPTKTQIHIEREIRRIDKTILILQKQKREYCEMLREVLYGK